MRKTKSQLRTSPKMMSRPIQRREATGGLSRHNLEDLRHQAALLSKRHILCVDEEVAGTRMRGAILEGRGYAVTICHSPGAALLCSLSSFDLAVLDFQMPEFNGRELLLRMRASGARFPVVLLTGGLNALSYEDRVLFARCIDKAEPIDSLLNTIAEFLDPNQIPDFGA